MALGKKIFYWDQIAIHDRPLEFQGECFALWPEYVDSDVCFKKAGFDSFQDTDDEWDNVFDSVLSALFTDFSQHGSPRLLAGELPVIKIGWFKKKEGSLLEALGCTARDDQFLPCCVGFGNPAEASLLTSDGHPIVWVFPGTKEKNTEWLKVLGVSYDLKQKSLDWSKLSPARERIKFEQ